MQCKESLRGDGQCFPTQRGGGERNLVAPAERSEILLRLFLCVCYVFQWHTNADRPGVCGSSEGAGCGNHWRCINWSVNIREQFDRFRTAKNIAWKLVFHDSLFLRRETNHWTAYKTFPGVSEGGREREADGCEEEGEDESVSRRQWGRCKERLPLEVIYKVNPAKNDPKLNYSLFLEILAKAPVK